MFIGTPHAKSANNAKAKTMYAEFRKHVNEAEMEKLYKPIRKTGTLERENAIPKTNASEDKEEQCCRCWNSWQRGIMLSSTDAASGKRRWRKATSAGAYLEGAANSIPSEEAGTAAPFPNEERRRKKVKRD